VVAPLALDRARELELLSPVDPAQLVLPGQDRAHEHEQPEREHEAQEREHARARLRGLAHGGAPCPGPVGARSSHQTIQSSSRRLAKPAPETAPSALIAATRSAGSSRPSTMRQ